MPMCNITGHLYDASGEVVDYGIVTFQLQQDMVYNGQKVVPFTITIDLSETSGYIDVTVFPTVNASPSGIAYKLEFDPDPDDTTKPMKSKPGYFRNYISVPDQASASLGSFVSALRGQPAANYMPVGGTVGTVGDDLTLGTGTATNKRIIANTDDVAKPEIRYNNTTNRWQFSDDGSAWQDFLQGGGGAVGGDLSGTVGAATVAKIRGSAVSTTAPSATGQILRWNNTSSQWEPSVDGTGLNVSASNLTTGTVPLGRLSGITNTEIAAGAAIAWTKISKTGSSLADLTTRSASDLTSGTVPTARLGSGTANATTYLRGDQTWAAIAGGGDVTGPASSVDDRIVTFDGVTGKLIQDSGQTVAGLQAAAVAAAEASILPVDLSGADVTNDLPLSKLAPASAATRLLGRGSSSGAGDWEEITLGSGLSMSANTLSATGGGGSGAPVGSLYVTLATDVDLTNERVLTGSDTVSVTDGGAGGNVTLAIPTSAAPQLARLGVGAAADADVKLKIAGQYGSVTNDAGNSGAAKTINWHDGNTQLLTLTGNCTLTLSNPQDGFRYLIALEQDGTGSRTVTWPANVKWPGGTAPTLSTAAGKVDIVTLVYFAGLGASGNYLAAANTDYTPA